MKFGQGPVLSLAQFKNLKINVNVWRMFNIQCLQCLQIWRMFLCFTCIVLRVYNTKENSYSGQVFSLRMKQARLVGMLSKDAAMPIVQLILKLSLTNYNKIIIKIANPPVFIIT